MYYSGSMNEIPVAQEPGVELFPKGRGQKRYAFNRPGALARMRVLLGGPSEYNPDIHVIAEQWLPKNHKFDGPFLMTKQIRDKLLLR